MDIYNRTHPEGLLVDLSNEQYHSGPGLSSTAIKLIGTSPLAFWDAYINPQREPQEFKHCFAVGDGTHKLVLEPGTFEKTYFVGFDKSAYPNALDTGDQLKAACKERGLMVSGTKSDLAERLVEEGGMSPDKIMLLLERQHLQSKGDRIEIPSQDYKSMLGMLRAIDRDPHASGLLAGADTEQSYFWRDQNGVLRKCRTDLTTADYAYVGDLKTTDDVSDEGFRRTVSRLGYHISAAWYLDLLKGLYGSDAPDGFFWIAVQKKRPHDVAVHIASEEQLRLGRLLYRQYLARLRVCLENDYWPGASGGEIIMSGLTSWDRHQLDILEGRAAL